MSRWDSGPHFKMFFIRNTAMLLIVCLTRHVTAEEVGRGSNRPWNGEWNKTAPQIQCLENEQYAHDGLCCRNCEAGTYVKKPCVKALETGTCAPCESGTYAEHATGMHRCLTCTPCHMDQEETVPCVPTQNRQCQCKRGSYCEADKPCEVCKKCARCKEDEEKAQNCTAVSNTVCRKKRSPAPPAATPAPAPIPSSATNTTVAVSVSCVLVILLSGIGIGIFCWYRKRRSSGRTETQSDQSGEVKIDMGERCNSAAESAADGQGPEVEEPRQESQPLLQETSPVGAKPSPVEDEDKGLGDSLPNTTNSSQTSLSALPTMPSCSSSPRPSPEAPRPPPCRAGRRLIPLNGEESLKKSFDLFDEFLDVQFHKRFFRSIGLSDNAIKNAENAHAADKVYELLKAWMQRRGFQADIDELLDVLLISDQKLSAESISSKAVAKGYYRYADERN